MTSVVNRSAAGAAPADDRTSAGTSDTAGPTTPAAGAPTRLDRFLAFSVEATAFTRYELVGTGQAEAYLAAVDGVVGPALVDDLLDRYDLVLARAAAGEAGTSALLRRHLLGDARLGPVARNLAKMWFVGTWYELPRTWTEAYPLQTRNETFVVSAGAYVEGLLWPAIGANPPGAKPPGFGSWSQPPRIPAPR
ncbi:hypothetical protein SAMN04488543_4277 [Friedmanniella luteola]|uniref:Membrane bound FAD containing D-sorbitol dehydrogenase n=1 Tax=Friedmanniella luteola TaxID=546871 RepID=A0A1H2A7U7_9ACTN|nr:hypothetical protein [Friedmanniella luteola]SDT41937.1 hypothetical protein SAMN04488543_4277 [Friedmanniella luteola]